MHSVPAVLSHKEIAPGEEHHKGWGEDPCVGTSCSMCCPWMPKSPSFHPSVLLWLTFWGFALLRMPLCPHPPLLPGLCSHSYLLMASAETVYPAFAIGDKVPTQLPDLKEELAGGEEAKMSVPREGGITSIPNWVPSYPHPEKNHNGMEKKKPCL